MNTECEHCTAGSGIYDQTRRCCQLRLISNMPKERRQGYYKQVERTQGRKAATELIAEVNALYQAKRETKLKGGTQ